MAKRIFQRSVVYGRWQFGGKPSLHERFISERMRNFLAIGLVLAGLKLVAAQGVQGSITLSGNAIIMVTGHSVILSWIPSQGATGYNVYRSAVHGGPYTRVATEIMTTTYCDTQVIHNQTLYYVTTAVNGNNESGYSNEAVGVIP